MADQEKSSLETSHIKPTVSITPDEYMKDRVVYKINLYDKLSKRQKFWYQLTSVSGVVGAASVPVLINLGVNTALPTFLSLAVTILVSLEKLYHFREHWRNYDGIAAFLRSEQLQFQTLAGVYTETCKPDDAFRLFVKRVEGGVKDERNDTIEMRTRENQ